MKLLMIGLSFMFSLSAFSQTEVKYKVTFKALWTPEKLPNEFPRTAHFSSLIGASHSGDFGIFQEGELATAPVKDMAERGRTSGLISLFENGKNNQQVLSYQRGNSISAGTGNSSIILTASKSYPRLSVVSMIAPSPDWFVGLNSFRVIKNEKFLNRIVVPAFAFDSGTDAGRSFSSANSPLGQPHPVKILNKGDLFVFNNELQTFGEFIIEKLN